MAGTITRSVGAASVSNGSAVVGYTYRQSSYSAPESTYTARLRSTAFGALSVGVSSCSSIGARDNGRPSCRHVTQASRARRYPMSRSERIKGAAGEREVAAIFRARGFDCDRTPNSGGLRFRGDLYGNVPVHIEVKRQEVLRLPLWLRQAADEAGERVPVVAFRQSRGEWYAALPLDALAELLEAQAVRSA